MWQNTRASVAPPTYIEQASIRECIEALFASGVVDELMAVSLLSRSGPRVTRCTARAVAARSRFVGGDAGEGGASLHRGGGSVSAERPAPSFGASAVWCSCSAAVSMRQPVLRALWCRARHL